MKTDFTPQFISIIENDAWMLRILEIVRNLHLPDC